MALILKIMKNIRNNNRVSKNYFLQNFLHLLNNNTNFVWLEVQDNPLENSIEQCNNIKVFTENLLKLIYKSQKKFMVKCPCVNKPRVTETHET